MAKPETDFDTFGGDPILMDIPKAEYRYLVQFEATAGVEINRLTAALAEAEKTIHHLSEKHMELQEQMGDGDED